MNRLCYWLSLLVVFGSALSAGAGILSPVDPHRQADLSNKTVPVTTLNLPTISPTGRGMPGMTTIACPTIESKNLDRQTLPPGAVLEKISAELHPRETDTLKKPVLAQPVIATSQVAGFDKSAGKTGVVSIATVLPPARQIAPNTAAGEQELKDQLKRIP